MTPHTLPSCLGRSTACPTLVREEEDIYNECIDGWAQGVPLPRAFLKLRGTDKQNLGAGYTPPVHCQSWRHIRRGTLLGYSSRVTRRDEGVGVDLEAAAEADRARDGGVAGVVCSDSSVDFSVIV